MMTAVPDVGSAASSTAMCVLSRGAATAFGSGLARFRTCEAHMPHKLKCAFYAAKCIGIFSGLMKDHASCFASTHVVKIQQRMLAAGLDQ